MSDITSIEYKLLILNGSFKMLNNQIFKSNYS